MKHSDLEFQQQPWCGNLHLGIVINRIIRELSAATAPFTFHHADIHRLETMNRFPVCVRCKNVIAANRTVAKPSGMQSSFRALNTLYQLDN